MTKKKSGRRYLTKSFSIPPELEKPLLNRIDELGYSGLSAYAQALINQDIETGGELGAGQQNEVAERIARKAERLILERLGSAVSPATIPKRKTRNG